MLVVGQVSQKDVTVFVIRLVPSPTLTVLNAPGVNDNQRRLLAGKYVVAFHDTARRSGIAPSANRQVTAGRVDQGRFQKMVVFTRRDGIDVLRPIAENRIRFGNGIKLGNRRGA